MTASEKSSDKRPGLVTMILSVLAAMFGVQSDKNRRRDFAFGSATPYIALGIGFVVVFVLVLVVVVNLVIAGNSAA
ncbi:DUF2970 domain-containing protein [Parasalinivibrio latis]|uniref:DUF2970 domain-containing protein n=1 Tax=Parasalinivibrio latis TaxID=2952610 RepID=UPI0030E2BC51